MSYKIVNAEQLDADLTSVADSIRAKVGKSDKLEFPSGFKSAIDSITKSEIKNQDITITENGTYTPASGFTGFGSVKVEVESSLPPGVGIYYIGTASSTFALDFESLCNGYSRKPLYTYNCEEASGGTSLTSSVDCGVGDLVIAAIITRDTLTLSDGWTLISTSDVNNTSGNGQRLSFAYKYATSKRESITVTQASSQRLYINLVALQGATGYVDNGYSYEDTAATSITVAKPDGLVLWACSAPLWFTSEPYPIWTVSNDSVVLVLGTSTQSRLAVVLDESTDESVTFTAPSDTTMIIGSLTITGMSGFTE